MLRFVEQVGNSRLRDFPGLDEQTKPVIGLPQFLEGNLQFVGKINFGLCSAGLLIIRTG